MSPYEEMLYTSIRLLTFENFFYLIRCFLNVFMRMADNYAVICSLTFCISNIGDYAFMVQWLFLIKGCAASNWGNFISCSFFLKPQTISIRKETQFLFFHKSLKGNLDWLIVHACKLFNNHCHWRLDFCLALMSFEQGGIFIVPCLLWQTSV